MRQPRPVGGHRLMVLSGPSGVGKGTVVAALRRRRPDVWVSVSCTTREPRPGEVEGHDYYFLTRDRFTQMIDRGELLEFDEHFGHIYGTPRAPVEAHLRAGIPTLLEIEPRGARQVRSAMPGAFLVFLRPPSWPELERRLTTRGTESAERVAERLRRAREELNSEAEFDAVVVNDDVERAAAELVDLLESSCGPADCSS